MTDKLRTIPALSYSFLAQETTGSLQNHPMDDEIREQALFIVKDGSDLQLQNSLSSALGIHKFNDISASLFLEGKIEALIVPFARLHELDLLRNQLIEQSATTRRVALIGSFTADEINLLTLYFEKLHLDHIVLCVADNEEYQNLITEATNALPQYISTQSTDKEGFSSKLADLRKGSNLMQKEANLLGLAEPFDAEIIPTVIHQRRELDRLTNWYVGYLRGSSETPLVPFDKKSFTHLCAAQLLFTLDLYKRRRNYSFEEAWDDLQSKLEAPVFLVTSSVTLMIALGLEFLKVAIKQDQLPLNQCLDLDLISKEKQDASRASRVTCASISYDCFNEALRMLRREDLQADFDNSADLRKMLGLLPQLLDLAKIYKKAVW